MICPSFTYRQYAIAARYLTYNKRNFTVLAIESSADDTCAAVVNSSRKILSNIVIKQHDIHEAYGGIYPLSAVQSHQRNMPFAVKRALDDAGVNITDGINGIAVTRGPGMTGCLGVGLNAAKTLAAAMNLPLVGVHHMQAHALTALLTTPTPPDFPFLVLLISGGHTLVVLATSLTSYRILATTSDESIGRAFDKVSKLLALKWTKLGPGDALEKFCRVADSAVDSIQIPSMPRSLLGEMEFSFSGLHSRVERFIHELGGIEHVDLNVKQALARAFQTSAVAQLEEKLLLCLQWCLDRDMYINSIIVSGGVASNQFLRERLYLCLKQNQKNPIPLLFPPANLCTDNAAMIGWASMHRFLAGDCDSYDIEQRSKWNIEDLLDKPQNNL